MLLGMSTLKQKPSGQLSRNILIDSPVEDIEASRTDSVKVASSNFRPQELAICDKQGSKSVSKSKLVSDPGGILTARERNDAVIGAVAFVFFDHLSKFNSARSPVKIMFFFMVGTCVAHSIFKDHARPGIGHEAAGAADHNKIATGLPTTARGGGKSSFEFISCQPATPGRIK